jgi:hypothetical protein
MTSRTTAGSALLSRDEADFNEVERGGARRRLGGAGAVPDGGPGRVPVSAVNAVLELAGRVVAA